MRVAEALPAALTDFVYLEQWLRGSRLDLIVRLDEHGRDVLLRSPVPWPRVEAMARQWARSARLRAATSALWLEFDLDAARDDAAAPGPRVFVDFTTAAATQPSIDDRHQLALEAIAPLIRRGATERTSTHLRRLLDALPPDAHLLYVGAAHDGVTIRACIAGLAGDRLVQYLTAIGWRGDAADLSARVLAPLAPASCALLHLDLTDAALPRAGLEYVLDRRAQRGGLIREEAFLDGLVERGWCERTHRESLRAWPGQSTELLPHDVWYSRVVRRVNHVKVVYDAHAGIAAKAYLCFFHRLAAGRSAHAFAGPPAGAGRDPAAIGHRPGLQAPPAH
jgi:hypothetical protein